MNHSQNASVVPKYPVFLNEILRSILHLRSFLQKLANTLNIFNLNQEREGKKLALIECLRIARILANNVT